MESTYCCAKVPSSPSGEYFYDNFAVFSGKDLKGITFPDPKHTPDLFRNNDPAQIVDTSDNSCGSHT